MGYGEKNMNVQNREMAYTEMMKHIEEAKQIMNEICDTITENTCEKCPLFRPEPQKKLCNKISRIR